MSSIFGPSFGGMQTMTSATSEANILKGQASAQAGKDKEFAQKLKALQEKAEETKAMGAGRTVQEEAKLRDVCREMESVFLNMMLSKMRDTVPERTLFPKSSGEKIMQSMLDVELTRTMAAGGGIGLGELLYKQLSNPGLKSIPSSALQNNEGK